MSGAAPDSIGSRGEERDSGPRAPSCPECGGTGYSVHTAEDGVARAKRCSCGWVDRVETLLKDARIPKRYRNCSFENYDTLELPLERAKSQVQKFVEEYPTHDFGLLLLGSCGVGKTHLAAAALTYLVREKGVFGLFYDFRDLLKEIQASYNPVSGTTEMGILQPIFGAEVLVLDDLGANKMTDWVKDTLSHIINNRYNERRVTIVTTNLEDEITTPSRGDERVRERPLLRDQIGDPLRSRLYEMCEVINLTGVEDFRMRVRHTGRRHGPLG